MRQTGKIYVTTVAVLYLLGLLVVIAVRLVDLGVIQHNYFKKLSEQNRLRKIVISAPRGKILARGQEEIATNIDIPQKVEYDDSEGFVKVSDSSSTPQFIESKRQYVYGSDFADLSGYLGLPTPQELDMDICGRFNMANTYIGRNGLEEQYNCDLLGEPGEVIFEVDTQGKAVRILGVKKPTPGHDLTTNIDFGLQRKVAALMQTYKGAVVVSDAEGKILALYSSPSYDANWFVDSKMAQQLQEVLNNPDQPLFNRALSGRFHPGSTYKLLTSIAGLSSHAISKDTIYDDRGFISLKTDYGEFVYNNWYYTQYGRVEGEINIVDALARSTDTFFYDLGGKVGIDELERWAKKLKLDQPSGIDLPGEVTNLIPSSLWKEKTKGEKWFLGNTYHVAIGQGDVQLTPLAVNDLTRIVANGGKFCTPRVVGEGKCQEMDIDSDVLSTIKEGLSGACSTGGTGYTFFDFQIGNLEHADSIACKTGTAETYEADVTHAWFTFFAPVSKPQIVVTVLVEGGGEGSATAGPIAREIANFWFKK